MLKDIKPVSKICRGRLTKNFKVDSPQYTSAEKIVRQVFNLRGEVESATDFQQYGNFLNKRNYASLEMDINHVTLSDSGYQYVKEELGASPLVSVAWKIMDRPRNFSIYKECNDMKISYNSVYIYKIVLDDMLLNTLKSKNIIVELYAKNMELQICLGRGKASLEQLVTNPGEKYHVKVEISDCYRTRQAYDKLKSLGFCDFTFKLNCDIEYINTMLNNKTSTIEESISRLIAVNPDRKMEFMSTAMGYFAKKKEPTFKSIMPTDSEFNHFEEALELVLTRNKALRTTQQEISDELQERTQWLRGEANWRRTLREHTILSGYDPSEVRWRQWRDEHTANVSIREYPDFPASYEPELTITVVKLILFEDSDPMIDETITQFYMEYELLDYTGPKMETPYSIPKTESVDEFNFNFKKKFPFDLQKNQNECRKLADMIKNKGKIKFMVISEPVFDETANIQTCSEVGFCEVSLFSIVQLQKNEAAYWFDVINCKNTEEVIGYLKVQIGGILAIRRMALKILAPSSYNIIQ